jgi:DNA-binding transcriptional MerR regulator
MKIGEFVKLTGIQAHTLRYYEKIGILPKTDRTKNRYRNYTEKDLKRIEFIQKAKTLGLNLLQIAHILDLNDKGIKPCPQVRKILENKLSELKSQIDLLISSQRDLDQWIKQLPSEGIEGEICGCIETHTPLLTLNQL